MESGVEAGHLRQVAIKAQERLDRSNFAGQVVRVIRDDGAQLVQHLRCDERWAVETIAAVNDAMTDDGDVRQTNQVAEYLD